MTTPGSPLVSAVKVIVPSVLPSVAPLAPMAVIPGPTGGITTTCAADKPVARPIDGDGLRRAAGIGIVSHVERRGPTIAQTHRERLLVAPSVGVGESLAGDDTGIAAGVGGKGNRAVGAAVGCAVGTHGRDSRADRRYHHDLAGWKTVALAPSMAVMVCDGPPALGS